MLRGEGHKSYKRASIKAYLLLRGLIFKIVQFIVILPRIPFEKISTSFNETNINERIFFKKNIKLCFQRSADVLYAF